MQPGAGVFSRATSDINWRTGNSYFDDLRVWVDANEDGVTDPGELKTLDELGIASISLQGTGNQGETIADNDIVNRTSFTRANGTTGEVASVDFEVNSAGATLTQLPGATVVRAYGAETVTSYNRDRQRWPCDRRIEFHARGRNASGRLLFDDGR